MKRTVAILLATIALPAIAHMTPDPNRPAEDVARDAARHPGEMVDFAKIKPGSMVADFIPGGGYFTRVFAKSAGPTGHVTAIIPPVGEKLHPDQAQAVRALAADARYGNVSVIASPAELAPGSQDVIWTAQNYHDIHNAPDSGLATMVDKAMLAALKPGGYYVIVDHAAAAGSGFAATNTLHRIDPAALKAEVVAAGFVFDGESKVLANPADDHMKAVFDPSIRGKTDQFAYRFRKP